jgi:hypothetical protein
MSCFITATAVASVGLDADGSITVCASFRTTTTPTLARQSDT